MRVNTTLPAHAHRAIPTDKATGDSKRIYGGRGAGNYAMPKAPNAATPLTTNRLLDKATYSTGDGDHYHAPQRPGSDHSHIKSWGHPC
jgi:hypothetical protein